MDGGDPGNGGNHHTRQQLHGGYVPIVEGTRAGRKNLKNA